MTCDRILECFHAPLIISMRYRKNGIRRLGLTSTSTSRSQDRSRLQLVQQDIVANDWVF